MTTESKLLFHLLHIIAPIGVPLTGPQQTELLNRASRAQRLAAVERAKERNPSLLPDEMEDAAMWAGEAR